MKSFDYTNLVGCLNYLACSSRPDIAFAANCLSPFVENPGEKHWKAGKRFLRYLKCFKSKSLVFRRGGKLTLECFSDADWAGNLDHRKSTSGYCFKLVVAQRLSAGQQVFKDVLLHQRQKPK